MRAGLLHDDQRDVRLVAGPLARLSVEPRDDQVTKRWLPDVAVTLVEEVARLLPLDVVEEGQLRIARRGGPRERDRPPDAEMMTQMRIVDRHGLIELREHPQKPGAATARGAEDPDETILAADQAEVAIPRWTGHCSQRTTEGKRYPLGRRRNATAPAKLTARSLLESGTVWGFRRPIRAHRGCSPATRRRRLPRAARNERLRRTPRRSCRRRHRDRRACGSRPGPRRRGPPRRPSCHRRSGCPFRGWATR